MDIELDRATSTHVCVLYGEKHHLVGLVGQRFGVRLLETLLSLSWIPCRSLLLVRTMDFIGNQCTDLCCYARSDTGHTFKSLNQQLVLNMEQFVF